MGISPATHLPPSPAWNLDLDLSRGKRYARQAEILEVDDVKFLFHKGFRGDEKGGKNLR
jgi:hypothetical protein